MQRAVVVVEAAFVAMDDEHREAQSVLIGWRVLLAGLLARQTASALVGTGALVQAPAAPPQAAPPGAVQPTQREAAGAEGDAGARRVADAQGAAGEDGGAADGAMAALAVLPVASVAAAHGVAVAAPRELGQIHQDRFRVAGHQLLVGANVPLQLCAVDCVDSRDVPATRTLLRWRCWHKVKAKQLLHVVVHTGGAVLRQHPQRPGEREGSCHPEGGVGSVPGGMVEVSKANHVLLKVNILQMHPLAGLHVIIQALVFCEKPGSLGQVGVF